MLLVLCDAKSPLVSHADISPRTRIATVRGYSGPPERGISFHPVRVRDYARERSRLDQLRHQAEAGQLTLRVSRTMPARQAADAHRALEAGGVRGRIVLEF